MDIITARGTELSDLLHVLRTIVAEHAEAVHTLRIAIDGDEVKFKVNEGIWSPGFGSREVTR